jgi:hypothetical protein
MDWILTIPICESNFQPHAQTNASRLTGKEECARLKTLIAGMVAAMTESELRLEGERTSHHALG